MLRCTVLFCSEVNKPQTRQGSGNSPRKCCPKERKKERKKGVIQNGDGERRKTGLRKKGATTPDIEREEGKGERSPPLLVSSYYCALF